MQQAASGSTSKEELSSNTAVDVDDMPIYPTVAEVMGLQNAFGVNDSGVGKAEESKDCSSSPVVDGENEKDEPKEKEQEQQEENKEEEEQQEEEPESKEKLAQKEEPKSSDPPLEEAINENNKLYKYNLLTKTMKIRNILGCYKVKCT